jgi:hypothetical protein
VFAVVVAVTAAFLVISFVDKQWATQVFAKGVDWRLVPASILILFALWIISGLALACSTRLEVIPTLSVCSALFMIGLMSDYIFGRSADHGSIIARICYAVVPNWQQLWLADALESGRSIPWNYVWNAFVYMACYLGAVLAVALVLFEDRELN